jgi:hypothetical protein
MWHTAFITVHATAATIALVSGVLALPAGRFLLAYRCSLALSIATLVPALLVDWTTTDTTARLVFSGLLALGAVMVLRAELAARLRPERTGGPTAHYLDHIGFTLISLTEAFVIVALIRAGVPGWLIAVAAVGLALTGHVLLQNTKARLTTTGTRRRWPRPTRRTSSPAGR